MDIFLKQLIKWLRALKKNVKPDTYYKLLEAIRMFCSVEINERQKMIEYK